MVYLPFLRSILPIVPIVFPTMTRLGCEKAENNKITKLRDLLLSPQDTIKLYTYLFFHLHIIIDVYWSGLAGDRINMIYNIKIFILQAVVFEMEIQHF